jgi:hypothetical protein
MRARRRSFANAQDDKDGVLDDKMGAQDDKDGVLDDRVNKHDDGQDDNSLNWRRQ